MTVEIKTDYIKLAAILLITEIAIALFLKDGFIRFTIGDFLATILVYTFLRSFVKLKPIYIAVITLLIAFSIEFMQLFNVLDYLDLRRNRLVSTIFGNHFSIEDLIAYTLGVITIFIIDLKFIHNENI